MSVRQKRRDRNSRETGKSGKAGKGKGKLQKKGNRISLGTH